MIKNIFFSVAIFATVCSTACAMDLPDELHRVDNLGTSFLSDSVELFGIQADDLNMSFRRIDLSKISQAQDDHSGGNDRQTLMHHCGDFDAVWNMFGLHVALPFKLLHIVSPATVLGIYVNAYDDKLKKMPNDQKVMYHWFIEDASNHYDFVGYLSVSTYIDHRPEQYAKKLLLELAGVLSEKYRNKKIASKLIAPVLEKLKTFSPFFNGLFCFNTRTDNEIVHRIASKLNVNVELHSNIASRDFGLWTEDQSSDLFILLD